MDVITFIEKSLTNNDLLLSLQQHITQPDQKVLEWNERGQGVAPHVFHTHYNNFPKS